MAQRDDIDPPHLNFAEQLGRRAPSRLALIIHYGFGTPVRALPISRVTLRCRARPCVVTWVDW